MKYDEFLKQNNLTKDTIADFFKTNIIYGRVPVALYICPECDELMDYNIDKGYYCPICKGD